MIRAKICLLSTKVANQSLDSIRCNKTPKTHKCRDLRSCLCEKRARDLMKMQLSRMFRWMRIQTWAKAKSRLPKRPSIVQCSTVFTERVAKMSKPSNSKTNSNKLILLMDSSGLPCLTLTPLRNHKLQTTIICLWIWNTSSRAMQSCSQVEKLTCLRNKFQGRSPRTEKFCQNNTVLILQDQSSAKWA